VATSSAANSVVVPWRPVSDSPVEIRCGAGFMKAGLGAIDWSGLGITTAAIVFSPLLGFALALLLVLTVSWVFVRSTPVKVGSRSHCAAAFKIRSAKMDRLITACWLGAGWPKRGRGK
jgi:phosphate/sulfate permease